MNKVKLIVLSLFVVFNVAVIIRSYLPADNSKSKVMVPVDFVIDVFNLRTGDLFFTPEDMRTESYVAAEVEFMDGSKDFYEFPRSSQMKWSDRYSFGEKFRRFIAADTQWNSDKLLQRDTAKFVLRKLKEQNFYKIPLKVDLYHYSSITPLVDRELVSSQRVDKKFSKSKLYTYEVL